MLSALAFVASIAAAESLHSQSILDVSIHDELGPRLSPDAAIFESGSPHFANLTTRWQSNNSPDSSSVVVVATEEDVQETVW